MHSRQQIHREPALDIETEHHEELIEDLNATTGDNRREVLCQFVETLPPADDFNFILILTYFVERCIINGDDGRWFLEELEMILKTPIDDINRDLIFIRFAAFHALTIHSYSTESVSRWGERHDEFGHHFKKSECHNMYEFDYAMYLYHTGRWGNIEDARQRLQRLVDGSLRNNPGVLNAYVSCTLEALQKGIEIDEAVLQEVEEIIERAIDLFPYSEYFLKQGRIKAELEKFEEGISQIREGMDREDSMNYNKLSEYRHWINSLKYYKQRNIISNDIRNLSNQVDDVMDNIRSEMVQFLAFFSAIITFIVTTVQFSTNMSSVSEAATLIALMSGCLIIVFSAFRFMFTDPLDELPTVFLVWGVGLGLIGISVVIALLA